MSIINSCAVGSSIRYRYQFNHVSTFNALNYESLQHHFTLATQLIALCTIIHIQDRSPVPDQAQVCCYRSMEIQQKRKHTVSARKITSRLTLNNVYLFHCKLKHRSMIKDSHFARKSVATLVWLAVPTSWSHICLVRAKSTAVAENRCPARGWHMVCRQRASTPALINLRR